MQNELSLMDAAVKLLETEKKPYDLYQLFDIVTAQKGFSENEKSELVTKFYTDLTTSAKFVYAGDNTWDLKANQKIELWEKDGSFYKEYTVVVLPEDYKEKPKPMTKAAIKAAAKVVEKAALAKEKAEKKIADKAAKVAAKEAAKEALVEPVIEPVVEPVVDVVVEAVVDPIKDATFPESKPSDVVETYEEEVFEEYEDFDEDKYNEYMDTYEDKYDKK